MRVSTRGIDYKKIADQALSFAHPIASRVAPSGRVMGHEYKALNPLRNDKRIGSFAINLQSGAWADFATGVGGRDLISLWAWRYSISQSAAAREIAAFIGISVR